MKSVLFLAVLMASLSSFAEDYKGTKDIIFSTGDSALLITSQNYTEVGLISVSGGHRLTYNWEATIKGFDKKVARVCVQGNCQNINKENVYLTDSDVSVTRDDGAIFSVGDKIIIGDTVGTIYGIQASLYSSRHTNFFGFPTGEAFVDRNIFLNVNGRAYQAPLSELSEPMK
jgi:hypothetical protein